MCSPLVGLVINARCLALSPGMGRLLTMSQNACGELGVLERSVGHPAARGP